MQELPYNIHQIHKIVGLNVPSSVLRFQTPSPQSVCFYYNNTQQLGWGHAGKAMNGIDWVRTWHPLGFSASMGGQHTTLNGRHKPRNL